MILRLCPVEPSELFDFVWNRRARTSEIVAQGEPNIPDSASGRETQEVVAANWRLKSIDSALNATIHTLKKWLKFVRHLDGKKSPLYFGPTCTRMPSTRRDCPRVPQN
jgi:hypothetical protein